MKTTTLSPANVPFWSAATCRRFGRRDLSRRPAAAAAAVASRPCSGERTRPACRFWRPAKTSVARRDAGQSTRDACAPRKSPRRALFNSPLPLAALAAALALAAAALAPAADITWATGSTGNWDTPENWQNGAVPAVSDTASFGSGAVTLAGSATTAAAAIGITAGATASVTIANGGLWMPNGANVLAPSGTFIVGKSGTGLLTVESGAILRSAAGNADGNYFLLGDGAGSYGKITIKSGALWESGGVFVGGSGGSGMVHIEAGGTLAQRNATLYVARYDNSYGEVIVDGYYISGGNNGGVPAATNGTYYVPIAYNAGATGVFTVGTNGIVVSAQIDIAKNATATGTVTIHGRWDSIVGTSAIGNPGEGHLIIKDGGVLNHAGRINIGANGNKTSTITIEKDGLLNFTADTGGNFVLGSGSAVGYDQSAIAHISGTILKINTLYIGEATTGSTVLNLYPGSYITTINNSWFNRNPPVNSPTRTNGFSTANVDGYWYTGGYLRIAENGSSVLDIGPTGVVEVATYATLGNTANSRLTTVNVEGRFILGTYLSNNYGTAVLNIKPNGFVEAATYVYFGNNTGASGTLTISAGGALTAGDATNGVRIGSNYGGTGTATVSGLLYSAGPVSVGHTRSQTAGFVGAIGVLTIAQSGTVIASAGESALGNLGFGSGATVSSASGTAFVNGVWLNTGNTDFSVGRSGDGVLFLYQTGTITNRHAYIGRYYSTGHATGTATVSGVWASSGNMFVADNGIGHLTLNAGGTITVGGNTAFGNSANGIGSGTIAGHWSTGGNFTVGNLGVAYLEIGGASAVTAGGNYQQNARSTLSLELLTTRALDTLDPSLTAPLVNVGGAATLSGTLYVSGSAAIATIPEFRWNAAGEANASTLAGIPVLRAAGGITGDFDTVEIEGLTIPSTLPDYIRGGGLKVNEGGPLPTRYDIGYGLAWKAGVDAAHGTFDIDADRTFTVDVQLADRPGLAFASGWDGKSLVKLGPGTLILSVENAYTGATTVEEGTLRFAGPAEVSIGALINNSIVDLGSIPDTATASPGPAGALAAASPAAAAVGDAARYRTLRAASLAGSGTFVMAVDIAGGTGDRLVIAGDATGTHRLLLSGAGAMPVGDEPMPVLVSIGGVDDSIITAGGTAPDGTDIDAEGGFDYGAFHYAVRTDEFGNTHIANTNMLPVAFDPVYGVAGAQSLLWFDQQDSLSRRLGELRSPRAASGIDLWARAHAASATIGGGGTAMRRADVDLWGAEIGADYTWRLDGERATLGLFAGLGNTSQDFRTVLADSSATGDSDLRGAGLYAAWLGDTGWFANAILSAARYKNSFTATDSSHNRTTAGYDDNSLGVSLELGRRILLAPRDPFLSFADRNPNAPVSLTADAAWFVEPALQGSLARLARGDYLTRYISAATGLASDGLSVHGSDVSLTRLRAALRGGRVWTAGRAGRLEVAGRLALVSERSTGGEITIASEKWRPNLDGERYEAGLSLYWQPFTRGQLYFDYEYVTGDDYKKPWALSLGLRLSL